MARFRERAEAALTATGADKGSWGMLVSDADTGEILYALNASRYFAPASNAKLFTTAMALATLGPDFRIQTRIVGTGTLKSGRYRGDLVLVGAGDANLSNRVLPFRGKIERNGPPDKSLGELADQVAARGVKVIEGNVVADDSYLDRGRFPSGWTVDDTVWSYGAAVSAIAVNDNTLTLQVRPGKTIGSPLEFSVLPPSSIYQVRNKGVTSSAGAEAQLGLSREPESRVFYLGGSLPLGAAPRSLVVGVAEPAENAAALLVSLLKVRGIRVTGRDRAQHYGDPPAKPLSKGGPVVFAEHVSPPLLEDVRLTNKLSLNLHAELLLRIAAREKGGALTPDDALKFAAEFRQSAGLQPDEVLLNDGSGLSRGDLVTPRAIVQWLAWAQRQAWGADFRATLPVAGEDGTLDTRMKNTAAADRVQAKTGSFDHVEALSGYATSLRGARVIFSLLGNSNGLRNRDATAIFDEICVAMVEELGPAANAPETAPENPTP